MGSKFFTGFTFDLKRIAIGCVVMAFPFLVLLYREIPYYKYYFYGQPEYEELIVVNGFIAEDVRDPPKPYNKRADGIYIKIEGKEMNLYCDNPNKMLISYGTRGGGGAYKLGQCEWISGYRRKIGFCNNGSDEELCQNPRYFFGKKILARVDSNNTIYELYLEGKVFYRYEEMILNYQRAFIENIRLYFIISVTCLVVSIVCLILKFWSKYKR